MGLSILTSRFGRSVAILAGTALAAYLASALFITFVSPPAVEQREVRRLKMEMVDRLSQQGISKIIFVGGSATSFGVMPSVLKQQYGIESVNAGLTAGLGANFLLLWGCSLAEPGDTLIFLVEPGLFRRALHQTQPQTIAEMHMPATYWNLKSRLFRHNLLKVMPNFLSLRTSGRGVTGLLGEVLRGHPLSGNWIKNLDAYGTMTLPPPPPGTLKPRTIDWVDLDLGASLPDEGVRVLAWVADNCHKRGINVYYIFPKLLVKEDAVSIYNRQSLQVASDIERYIPVLNAGDVVSTNADQFLDSVLHLNPEGAKYFTEEIAGMLKTCNLIPAGNLK